VNPSDDGRAAGAGRPSARDAGNVGQDALDLLRTLVDPGRLGIVGTVAVDPRSSGELAELTGQDMESVLRTLAPLVQAGLIVHEHGRYRLEVAAWRAIAQELPQDAPASPRVSFGMTRDESVVLGRYFRGDRLVELPAQRSKRLVVLERLALEFEPGARYPESAVNDLLSRFFDDVATLRRQLVDEGFVDRADGEYWRSGGRVV
jgi:predicted transcriptional regulator